MASHKRDYHLPIRSILLVPALGAFLVKAPSLIEAQGLYWRAVMEHTSRYLDPVGNCNPVAQYLGCNYTMPKKPGSVKKYGSITRVLMDAKEIGDRIFDASTARET